MENSDATITLVSRDDARFQLPAKSARFSVFLRDATSKYFEDEADKDPKNIENVHVQRVGHDALEKVIQFLNHYEEEKMDEVTTPPKGNTFEEFIPMQWYREFVAEENMSQELLLDVMNAANYMGIQQLLDLVVLQISLSLTNKSEDEIRNTLQLPETTPEEAAQLSEEYRWIHEDN